MAPRVCDGEPAADGALDDDRRAPALEIVASAAREQLALAEAAEAGLDAASGAMQLFLNCLHRDNSQTQKSPTNHRDKSEKSQRQVPNGRMALEYRLVAKGLN